MSAFHSIVGKKSYDFDSLRSLLAKASPARSGDALAGIAAADDKERVAAQMALADVPLKRLLDEPIIPYEADEVTRLIVEKLLLEPTEQLKALGNGDDTLAILNGGNFTDSAFAKAFSVLENWARWLAFEPQEIEKERGVVIEEWRLGRGAAQRIRDRQFPILFKDSRYAERLTIGKKEILDFLEAATDRCEDVANVLEGVVDDEIVITFEVEAQLGTTCVRLADGRSGASRRCN